MPRPRLIPHLLRLALIFALILPLFSLAASAEEPPLIATAQAIVIVNIINNPPQITSISFSPSKAYSDSILTCLPEVQDEAPQYVTYIFSWYKNSELLLAENSASLSGFAEDNQITCEAIPLDVIDQRGPAFSATIKIQKTPFVAKAELVTLSLLGIKTTTAELLELNKQGIGSLTGYVASEIGSAPTQASYVGLLAAIILLILLIDLNIFIRYIIRRRAVQKS
jgi:hypothetical protein